MLPLPCFLGFQGCSLTYWKLKGFHYQMRTETAEMGLSAMVMYN